MTYGEFLARVIDDGIAAARVSYAAPEQAHKLEGSIAGFEACRDLDPLRLRELFEEKTRATEESRRSGVSTQDFWRLRCAALEVEWTCNCVSAALQGCGATEPILSWLPTGRGVMKAAEIIGVAA